MILTRSIFALLFLKVHLSDDVDVLLSTPGVDVLVVDWRCHAHVRIAMWALQRLVVTSGFTVARCLVGNSIVDRELLLSSVSV